MSNPRTYGLTHLAVAVSDLNRTRDFYQHIFDMETMYEQENMIQLTTPGCHDILVFEKSNAEFVGKTAGIAHFGFRLKTAADIAPLSERIMAAGAEIVEKGEFLPGSPYIFFKDPDGYIIEVWFELLP